MTSQHDRIEGVLLGTAAGDALGAPYEFGPPRGPDLTVEMAGGGPWAPGEWTDDTAMAIAIAEVAASGADLLDESAQDAIVTRWYEWSEKAKDVGNQTRAVLDQAGRGGAVSARAAAVAHHQRTGRSGGNGSLMRTAPVALAYLHDEDALVTAARSLSELTHSDPDAGDACVLWCSAIRHAVRTAELDVRVGLRHLDPDRRGLWRSRIEAAEAAAPSTFPRNGWVVSAFQAAWSAISTTPVPREDPARHSFRADHFRLAVDAAVRAGNDTDTVAAIAGGLLGGAHGASAVPLAWRRLLHGWPGLTAHGVVTLAGAIAKRGAPDRLGYRYCGCDVEVQVPHPVDVGVDAALGDVRGVLSDALPNGVFQEARTRRPIAQESVSESAAVDSTMRWCGVLDPNQLAGAVVTARHRLADAAKAGDWPAVFALLDTGEPYFDVNGCRPGGTAWFTPLHQAAWHCAPAPVVVELMRRGALRSLRDAKGRTPQDIVHERWLADKRHFGRVLNILRPPRSPFTLEQKRAIDDHLARVIDDRISHLYRGQDPRSILRYPPVEILHEVSGRQLWFPIPGMYGGFNIQLRDEHLEVSSWSRVIGGSGQKHVVTEYGATLVDESFV
ncbi:MAG: ADP-ribosylglycohydrolase family protein [Mycobacterium sp.]